MTTLTLKKDGGGWRHHIDDKPVYCGSLIEARIAGEWVKGRYETDDLSPEAPRPNAFLYSSGGRSPITVKEGTEARFPEKEG